jgi:hypothetical protein
MVHCLCVDRNVSAVKAVVQDAELLNKVSNISSSSCPSKHTIVIYHTSTDSLTSALDEQEKSRDHVMSVDDSLRSVDASSSDERIAVVVYSMSTLLLQSPQRLVLENNDTNTPSELKSQTYKYNENNESDDGNHKMAFRWLRRLLASPCLVSSPVVLLMSAPSLHPPAHFLALKVSDLNIKALVLILSSLLLDVTSSFAFYFFCSSSVLTGINNESTTAKSQSYQNTYSRSLPFSLVTCPLSYSARQM